ncbi:hypothetical protein, partial [Burkholderia diffusa]|uniref:hypothetical protein n=1 Tax=Burkholderia diffusa TaxID=488732 RepID=UPI001C2D7884
GPTADSDDGSLQPDAVEIAGRVAPAERLRYQSGHREAHDVDPFALKSAERAEIERFAVIVVNGGRENTSGRTVIQRPVNG